MGDEAFARRYYADRAELQGLGVPITSGRDEFTGEELYTLREEQYFLPPIDLNDQELAALLRLPGHAGRPVRVRRAAAAGAAEPGAGAARLGRPGLRLGARQPAGQRLHARDRPAAGEARAGDLEAADGAVQLPLADRRRPPRAADQPVRPVRAEQRLVRDRRRPRGARGGAAAQDLPRLPDGQRDQVRHPPRARLPDPGGLRRQRLSRPAAVAAGRRDRGRGGALDRRRTARSSPAGCTAGAARSPSTRTARRRWSPSTPTSRRCPSWCSSTSARCARSSRRSWSGWC